MSQLMIAEIVNMIGSETDLLNSILDVFETGDRDQIADLRAVMKTKLQDLERKKILYSSIRVEPVRGGYNPDIGCRPSARGAFQAVSDVVDSDGTDDYWDIKY